MHTWSKGAGKQGEQLAEGLTQDNPEVKEEIQYIENALLTVDRATIARYGGVNDMVKRLRELKDLPKSLGTSRVSIDRYETWVSSRLRMLDADL